MVSWIGTGFVSRGSVLELFDRSARPAAGWLPTAGAGCWPRIIPVPPMPTREAVGQLHEPCTVEEFGCIGRQGISARDPAGTAAKPVAYDASLLAAGTA